MAQVGIPVYYEGFSGYLIVVWKKATTPLAEAGRSDAISLTPSPLITTIVAPNLSPEVYNFYFWQSSDGVTLDTLLPNSGWSIDASIFSDGLAETYEYVVDRGRTNISEGTGSEVWAEPSDGDTQIVDQRLAGADKTDLQVSMRGTGIRRSDEWNLLSGGGISLAVGGEAFASDDSIFITRFKKTSTTPVPAGSDYSDVINLSSDATVDISYKNKIVNCTGTAAVTTLTFPAFNTMADQKIKFVTHSMTGNYLTLSFTSGLFFAGLLRDKIHLSQGRSFELLIKNGLAYVISDIAASGYDVRGNRMLADDVKPHQLLLDGTVRQIADFPGIVEWIQTLPGSSVITSYASWNTDANKHKYYLNTGAGEFALPDDRNMHYRALSTFSGVIGRYEADGVKIYDDTHKAVKVTGENTAKGTLDNITTPGHQFDLTAVFDISTPGATETTIKNVGQLAVVNM